MNFEERLRAALEDKVYKELETSELKGIQKAYLAIDNRIIQLARETDHFKLYIKNNYDIIIKYRLDNGKVETEALYISDLDTELEKDHMDGSRLMYYIYSNHEYDKGIKISQYEETNDGDKVYPGLEIEFVRKEVAKPLKDRILEIRKCVSLVEDKNTAWRKSIAASVLDLVENLNDEILKLAATGEHQAEIYMAGNSIFITKTRTEENPSLGEIKSYGLQIKKIGRAHV